MTTCRARRGKYDHQGMQPTRSHNRKPTKGYWVPTVPAWEKSFCASVDGVPWEKILEAKKTMHLYSNILQWDDSAGEEAFKNAKCRFYACNNGLSCNIPLPDPDLYIDEIDWDNETDPELFLNLKLHSDVPKDEGVVIFDNSVLWSQLGAIVPVTGWGDIDIVPEQEHKPCICHPVVLEDYREQDHNPTVAPLGQDRYMIQYTDQYGGNLQGRNTGGRAGWPRQGLYQKRMIR